MNPSILIAVIFSAVALFVYGFLSVFVAEDRVVRRRLQSLTSYEASEFSEAEPTLKSFGDRIIAPLADAVVAGIGGMGPAGYMERLEAKLVLAGDPAGMKPATLFALKVALASLLGLLGMVPGLSGIMTPGPTTLFALVGVVAGFMGPDVWLRFRRESRQSAIRRELPDMLEMLTISVEAGLGFDAALSKYVKNSRSVLAYEFGRVLKEIQGGVSRRDGLRRLQKRTDVRELNSFISAMIQADMLGTSVAEVLRTQAVEIRLRHRQHVEEQAQKLPVKMVFPVILCILPATILVVIGPAIIMIVELFR